MRSWPVLLVLLVAAPARSQSLETLLAQPAWDDVTPLADGRRYLVAITRGGSAQLAIGERGSAAPPRLLTHADDGIAGYALAADGRRALVSIDVGHKSQARLWSVPLDGSEPTALTSDEPINRLLPFVPAARPELVIYEVRRHDEPGSFIYTQRGDRTEPPRLAFHDAQLNGWLRDASRDGRQALLFQFLTLSERALWRVDLDSGHGQRLYPPPGRAAAIMSARFSADGQRVYVATELGKHALLLALDGKSGRELARYVDAGSRLDDITISADGKRVAAAAQVGVQTQLRILDARTLAPSPVAPALPLGVGGPTAFTADGAQLSVSWETPNDPTRAYFVDIKTGAATLLGPAATSASPPIAASSAEVIARDGARIPTLVYRPRAADKRLPVVVFLHGGPTSISVAGYDWRWSWLVDSGFAIVMPNIRGSSGFGRAFEQADDGHERLRSFDDIADVAAWIAQQPWADSQRLVVYGQSYGGYLSLVALTRQPERWRAGIDAYGIADWRTFFATTNTGTSSLFQKEVGVPATDGAFLDEISPLGHVDRARAPLFVYQGVNDGQVPVAQSDRIVAAWRARGLRVEYMRSDDEGHGMEQPATRADFARRMLEFLRAVTR